MQTIVPFLMFEGNAEEAMRFYMSLFADSKIESLVKFEEGDEGPTGAVKHALFNLLGKQFMCIDSSVKHQFTFTPAISLYVACETLDEVDRLYAALSEGGEVFLPLMEYPFSERYAWVSDRYGVSWQLAFGNYTTIFHEDASTGVA